MSVFVIAEAGVNHNGDVVLAAKLADAAHEAGADAVKFQLFRSYQIWGDERSAHLELDEAEMTHIAWHCRKIGIEFMCTPFHVEGVAFLKALGVKRFKISSGCIADFDLLKEVRDSGLPVIVSTGMADMTDVMNARNLLDKSTFLHCTSAYPCPLEAVNLRAMLSLPYPYGYSDHTPGITVPIAATALGATVIEKHLTLDRNAEGPDHKTSITPADFRVMVRAIRDVQQALGDGVKQVQDCERELKRAWRDSR